MSPYRAYTEAFEGEGFRYKIQQLPPEMRIYATGIFDAVLRELAVVERKRTELDSELTRIRGLAELMGELGLTSYSDGTITLRRPR